MKLSQNKHKMSYEYEHHKIFDEVSLYTKYYNSLSFSVFKFLPLGTKGIVNIDSYMYSSIHGTLESMRIILENGRINDCYALLRKYYDAVIINTYEILYLQQNQSIDNFIIRKIDDWASNKEKLPEFKIMMSYIKKSEALSIINKLLMSDNRYVQIRERCNNHTHYNLFYYMLLNDNELAIADRIKQLDILLNCIRDVFILHFVYLFSLNQHYMSSEDYSDSIDCGLTPEEGSQYYVAPYIQNVFNSVIKPYRSDLAKELLNSTSMRLE